MALERIVPIGPDYNYGFTARNMGSDSATPQERLLGYFPIVLGDQVLVSDGTGCSAYNLNDRPGTVTATARRPSRPGSTTPKPTSGPASLSTAPAIPLHPHRAWAIGSMPGWVRSTPSPLAGLNGGTPDGLIRYSYIVALDWNKKGKLLWMQKSAT